LKSLDWQPSERVENEESIINQNQGIFEIGETQQVEKAEKLQSSSSSLASLASLWSSQVLPLPNKAGNNEIFV
jgi:hypothetical protein